MASRSRGYYRHAREKAIERKKRIINSYRADNPPAYGKEEGMGGYGQCDPYWYTEHEGTLAKGKIHCSCPMCAFHGTTRQDTKILMRMDNELADIIEEIDGTTVLCDVKPLRNKIQKKANGRYYPKTGFRGTRLGGDTKISVDDFNLLLEERKGIMTSMDRERILEKIRAERAESMAG